MLQEIQTWHGLVLIREEEIAKLFCDVIRLDHFCTVVWRNTAQQNSPQAGAPFSVCWADGADATHMK